MSEIELTTAETMLAGWIAAEEAVMTGQSYTFKDRTLTRADLRMIGERIAYWESRVTELSSGFSGRRVRGVTPL